VDPAAFDDRRNGKPLIFFELPEGEPFIQIAGVFDSFDLELPDFPDLPSYEVENFHQSQKYHVEVWAEKSTMNDILEPLCNRTKSNLITGVGEMSITSVQWLFDRLQNYQKPCRILYVSDFDPAGRSMPVAVSRKIEKFMYDSGNAQDVRLFPLVLTQGQCIEYQLPRTPIKESEKRAAAFEGRFGEGATELDALEALHPGKLARILSKAIGAYRDPHLAGEVSYREYQLSEELESIKNSIASRHYSEIEQVRGEYRKLQAEFQERVSGISQRVSSLWQAITEEMQEKAPDIDDYPLPEPEEAEEIGESLYDSNRGYFDQLQHYKQFQGK